MADDEKTEHPTGRRLSKAREEGNVAQSKELPAAVSMIAATFYFFFFSKYMIRDMTRLIREILSMTKYELDTQSVHKLMMFVTFESAKLLAPFMAMLLIVGVATNIYQVGWMISWKAMELKFNKINPFTGWGKFFNTKSLVELVKSVFKIFVIGYLAYYIVSKKIDVAVSIADMDINDIFAFFGAVLFEIMWKISLLVLIMAILDYMYQKYQYIKDLKMTKHEVKEEFKQMEGDPKIKSRIKQIQRDMARQRMMQDVPKSDVVVTNPTHYAVALRYNPGEDRAPVVLAKGERLIALRIREVAKEHGVLIHEAPPLARSLFKTVDIGSEIPENLYKAVAEILALVEKFKRPA